MPVTSIDLVKIHGGIESADTDYDTLISYLIDPVEKRIEKYLNGPLLSSQSLTEYYSGTETDALQLRHTPVTTLTSVNEDSDGYFGQGSSPFGALSVLESGINYALDIDQSGLSNTGIIWRVDGQVWLPGRGNYKIVYTAGYTSIPGDIVMAANIEILSILQKSLSFAGIPGEIGSIRLGDFSVNLKSSVQSVTDAIEAQGFSPQVVPILERYRRPVLTPPIVRAWQTRHLEGRY